MDNNKMVVKTKDDVKTKDSEIIDNVHRRYIDDKYRALINVFFSKMDEKMDTYILQT